MPPNVVDVDCVPTGPLNNDDKFTVEVGANMGSVPTNPPGRSLVWRNILLFVYLHVASLYGAYLTFTSAMWKTVVCGK